MKNMNHVTIVDDTIENLEVYKLYMERFFDLQLISNPHELCPYLHDHKTDLILLDVHMPFVNGIDLYKEKLSKCHPSIPVIFITADQSEDIVIRGLEAGAADVITKPISLRALVARISNKIDSACPSKHVAQHYDAKISFGEFTLDCEMQLAEISNKKINLTPIEFKILHLLAKNPNKVYSKENMKELLWPDVHVQNQNMDTHLSNLRKKTAPFSRNIKTIKSRGYVLHI